MTPADSTDSTTGPEPELDDEAVRDLVRAAMASTSLPRLNVIQGVDAALGDGQEECDICHTVIRRDHYGYEVRMNQVSLRVHFRCLRVWHEESGRPDDVVSK